ncbi:hypothetical protein BOX15_Mlig007145g1 [Macrostomum lignano]|uniref:Uncharacterized protein n=1 Tax=Macrostomum lignano TaxID=282301 RepID=A0A267GSK4_9PLAT|nr:hypothetical protein BOX15_Mlig007145g1 [Macrostomum lignano]
MDFCRPLETPSPPDDVRLLLDSAGDVQLSPAVCHVARIDGVDLPLIFAEADPGTPRVPHWMAELKLLWRFAPSSIAEQAGGPFAMPAGLEPSPADIRAIDLANWRQLCEFGLPQVGGSLADTRDCSLLPLHQLVRCYESARLRHLAGLLLASEPPDSLPGASVELLPLTLPNSTEVLCSIPCVHRAGLGLLPVSHLTELLPWGPWGQLEAQGLGVEATMAEARAIERHSKWPGGPQRLLSVAAVVNLLACCRPVAAIKEPCRQLEDVASEKQSQPQLLGSSRARKAAAYPRKLRAKRRRQLLPAVISAVPTSCQTAVQSHDSAA